MWYFLSGDFGKYPAVTCLVSMSPEEYRNYELFWVMTWETNLCTAEKEKDYRSTTKCSNFHVVLS